MPFEIVLDTCTLYPAHLRDTLLRLAERGFYRPLWSDDILEELHRSLLTVNIPIESVDRLLVEMRSAFCDARVEGYRSLSRTLNCTARTSSTGSSQQMDAYYVAGVV